MPTIPWKTLAPPSHDRDYVVLLTFLPLRSYLRIPLFFRFTQGIQAQLATTPGVVGYSLRAQPLSKRFWTLSAWESEAALRAFVAEAPHSSSMRDLAPHMAPTRFTRWRLRGAELPPRWDDALRRETTRD